ncbi:uncharacterized protein LOC127832288 isoform X3 [Dreissena polymorpha]|uniref:uncharacterized protein LOC127832288 isoform X3 n=1 Tax=Dreissena polymorpha TaxID=45954 RepID=UPI0022651C35|nr:uncharacterized protein LOC127832288 isoform X3 [Dreissena polymorpha]
MSIATERATTTSQMAKSYSDAVQNAINRKKASNKYCACKKLILCEPDIDDVHMEVEVGLPATQSQSDYEFVVRGLETNDASVPKYEDHVYAKAVS